MAKGGENLLNSREAQQRQGEVAAGGEVLGAVAEVGPAVIFAEYRVPDPMQAVLDTPMSAPERQDVRGGRFVAGERGDRVDELDLGFSLASSGALQAASLLQARPIQLTRQTLADLQMSPCLPAVAFFGGVNLRELRLPLLFARGGEIPAGTRPSGRPAVPVGSFSPRINSRRLDRRSAGTTPAGKTRHRP